MFNIGFSEFIAIAVIALIVIGPKQLPEVARVVAKLLNELRKAAQDLSGGLLEVKREVHNSIQETKNEILNEGIKIKDSVTQIKSIETKNETLEEANSNHQLNKEDETP
jgi:Tat protein translocase TatB subunit